MREDGTTMMLRSTTALFSLFALSAPFCVAAEIGLLGGYGSATSMTATTAGSSANTGFEPGAAAGIVVGGSRTERFGGEIRYLFLFDNLKVSQGGTQATLTGHSQLIHYDFLFHATPRSAAIRPFVAGGGGIRWVEGTGAQQVYQPLSQYALLTQTREVVALISAGGGIKFRLSPRLNLRLEVRDYVSPHLSKVIAASPGAQLHGWIHEIMPLAALTFTFH